MQVQKAALGAIDVASAADVERVNRRVRSLSDRLETLEDTIDALQDELSGLRRAAAAQQGTSAVKPARKG